MRVFIDGGAGYVGSALVPALLRDRHEVIVYDTFWFGDHLPKNVCLYRAEDDIRDVAGIKAALTTWGQVDAVIHLACLSNDPSSEIDKDLTRAINLDAFEPLVRAAREAGVRRFINCSTSSVYGISDAPNVTEDHPHVPLTLYNTYKSQCEEIFRQFYSPEFECITIRPSTVCGYAPRQRLDLAVNILTNQAVNRGKITVFGGAQMRPNLHIMDMVRCYRALLEAPADKVAGQTFNVGAGNLSIADLALVVRDTVRACGGRTVNIETKPVFDERSYAVNSDKIANMLGFRPGHSVGDAVADLYYAFTSGLLPEPMERAEYYNVRRMKEVFSDLYKDAPPSQFDPMQGHLSEIDVFHRGAK